MSTLDTFVANLGRAIQDHETITLGGGEFRPSELVEILKAIKLGQQVVTNAEALLDSLGPAKLPNVYTPVEAITNLCGVLRAYQKVTA